MDTEEGKPIKTKRKEAKQDRKVYFKEHTENILVNSSINSLTATTSGDLFEIEEVKEDVENHDEEDFHSMDAELSRFDLTNKETDQDDSLKYSLKEHEIFKSLPDLERVSSAPPKLADNTLSKQGSESENMRNKEGNENNGEQKLKRASTVFQKQYTTMTFHRDKDKEYITHLITLLEDRNVGTNFRNDHRYLGIRFIIFPDDYFKYIWDVIMAIGMLYTSIVTPYRVIFLGEEDDSLVWVIQEALVDIFFTVDIIFNFFLAYQDDHNQNLIVSRREIAKKYLLSWFIVDFIGVFPFDIVLETSKYSNLVLRVIKERNKIIGMLFDILRIGQGLQRILYLTISILLFCHIASCIWFFIADINEDGTDWITYYNYKNSDNIEIYIMSFYWITQTVVTVGYGDISPKNELERMIAILLMFVGAFLYSFTIGSITSLLSNIDSKNSHIEHKLNILAQIRSHYGIEALLYNRVKRAIKIGINLDSNNENILLETLPSQLRIELSVMIYKDVVEGIEFFNEKPPKFLALIGPLLRMVRIGEGELVVSEGDLAEDMFFVKEGEVSVVLSKFNNFPFMTISQSYFFGEVDLLFHEKRQFSYRADSNVLLLALSKVNFSKIFFKEFRDIGGELYRNALKRRERLITYCNEATSYCENKIKKYGEIKPRAIRNRKREYSFKPQNSLKMRFKNVNASQDGDQKNENTMSEAFDQSENQEELKKTGEEAEAEVQNAGESHEEISKKTNSSELEIKSPTVSPGTKSKGHSNIMKMRNAVKVASLIKKKDHEEKSPFKNKELQHVQDKVSNMENSMFEIMKIYELLGVKNEDENVQQEAKETVAPPDDLKKPNNLKRVSTLIVRRNSLDIPEVKPPLTSIASPGKQRKSFNWTSSRNVFSTVLPKKF